MPRRRNWPRPGRTDPGAARKPLGRSDADREGPAHGAHPRSACGDRRGTGQGPASHVRGCARRRLAGSPASPPRCWLPICPTTSPPCCWCAGWDLWREPGAYRSLTLMFQWEVVDRIVARPGDRAYGRRAVLTALSAAAAYRQFDVPAQAFTPPPKVTSAIVRIDARDSLPGPLSLFGSHRGRDRCLGPAPQDAASVAEIGVPDPVAVLEALEIAPDARGAAAERTAARGVSGTGKTPLKRRKRLKRLEPLI